MCFLISPYLSLYSPPAHGFSPLIFLRFLTALFSFLCFFFYYRGHRVCLLQVRRDLNPMWNIQWVSDTQGHVVPGDRQVPVDWAVVLHVFVFDLVRTWLEDNGSSAILEFYGVFVLPLVATHFPLPHQIYQKFCGQEQEGDLCMCFGSHTIIK